MFVALLVLPPTFASCAGTIDQTIDDATIVARVKTALLNDPQIGSAKIDVDAVNGIVTLSGRVKSEAEATRAAALARGAAGVTEVKSMLQVVLPTPRS
jgi:hyperosmotically inducible protein